MGAASDSGSPAEDLTLEGGGLGLTSVAFGPDGNRLAADSWEGTVKVWDAESGQVILTLDAVQGRRSTSGGRK